MLGEKIQTQNLESYESCNSYDIIQFLTTCDLYKYKTGMILKCWALCQSIRNQAKFTRCDKGKNFGEHEVRYFAVERLYLEYVVQRGDLVDW